MHPVVFSRDLEKSDLNIFNGDGSDGLKNFYTQSLGTRKAKELVEEYEPSFTNRASQIFYSQLRWVDGRIKVNPVL